MSGQIGSQYGPDGTLPLNYPRLGQHYEQISQSAHGKYYEATSRGNVYSAMTAVAGVAPGTALGTAPPIMLYNPSGSTKRLKLMKVTAGYLSGTLGAGSIVHCGFTLNGTVGNQSNVVPVTGSATGHAQITPVCMDMGNANVSVAIAATAWTLNANPQPLYPFTVLNAMLATTATNLNQVIEDVDGNITLEPGGGWCLQGITAAGTSPLMLFGVVYEEIGLIG